MTHEVPRRLGMLLLAVGRLGLHLNTRKVNVPAIVVKDLKKSYGEIRAVDGLSFEVEDREIFGILGPNGAGKTTTLEMIETIREPSLTKSLKTAQMASNAIAFPLMFLSGVFFTLSILPNFLATVAKLLPLYYLGHALREVMIQGKDLWAVRFDILVLIGMGLICFLVSIKLFRWE